MSASIPARPPPPGLMTLCLAAFASIASMRACDPLLPAFAKSFEVTTGNAALTISSFAIAYGLLQLLYGPLGDRYGKVRVIACAALACVVGNVLAALSGSIEMVVIARALSGATAGGIVPLTLAWVGDSVDYEQRQAVLARVMTATLLGTACGQWFSGLIADTVGWRWVFVALTALFLLVAIQLLRLGFGRAATLARAAVAPASADLSYRQKLQAILSQRWSRRVLVTTAVEGAFGFSTLAFVPAYLHGSFGLSLNHAAAVVATYAIGGLSYSVFARVLVARLGEAGLVICGASLMLLSYALLTLAPDWAWALPACVIGGLGFSMMHATLQTHATQMAPAARGTAASLFGCSLFFGQSLGVLAAALAVDHIGYRVVFAVAGIAVALLGINFSAALRARTRFVGGAGLRE